MTNRELLAPMYFCCQCLDASHSLEQLERNACRWNEGIHVIDKYVHEAALNEAEKRGMMRAAQIVGGLPSTIDSLVDVVQAIEEEAK